MIQLSRQTASFQSPALRQITLEVARVNGINLGQGVCNLPVPELVLELAARAAKDGINRYTNPRGLLTLREAVANKLKSFNRIEADPNDNVLITCGATGAFEGICGILLDPGDEVILFEPSYPYHVQALKRYQAHIKFYELSSPNWEIDFDHLRSLISPRTRFILVNTPGNPTGKVFSAAELEQLAKLLEGTNCLLVTDEIYEYMTFEGLAHVSPASLESLKSRTLSIGGYSKTFSITGWRIGYVVVPKELSEPMASFLDAVYVCAPAPLQQGVADAIGTLGPEFYQTLCTKYEGKRNRFVAGLKKLGLEPLNPTGAYYLICGYEARFPGFSSSEFARRMIAEAGVGAVPSSDFVRNHEKAHWVRFCLANEDDLLDDALARLQQLV